MQLKNHTPTNHTRNDSQLTLAGTTAKEANTVQQRRNPPSAEAKVRVKGCLETQTIITIRAIDRPQLARTCLELLEDRTGSPGEGINDTVAVGLHYLARTAMPSPQRPIPQNIDIRKAARIVGLSPSKHLPRTVITTVLAHLAHLQNGAH